MSEMVERVWKAILDALNKSDPLGVVSDGSPNGGTTCLDGDFDLSLAARAAIEAMRPTQETVEPGSHTIEYIVTVDVLSGEVLRTRWK